MYDDLISRKEAIDAVRELYIQSPKISNDIAYDTAIDQAHDALANLPSVQSESDKEKISELLMRLYLMGFVHLTKEVIVRKQHYCEELWKAIFHDDELPVWMHWYDIEREKS